MIPRFKSGRGLWCEKPRRASKARRGFLVLPWRQCRTFAAGAANPVQLQIGPGGDLFYADFDGGTIRRVSFSPANNPPTAVATASPTTGSAPLTVQFDGSGSTDPDPGDALSYAWDLDGDGQYDDSDVVAPTYTYTTQGEYTASLRATDRQGASSTAAVTISVGNTPPTATITAPAAGTTWKVGDQIRWSGSATDAQDGPLPGSALSWALIMHHCPSNCHQHPLQTFSGAGGGEICFSTGVMPISRTAREITHGMELE